MPLSLSARTHRIIHRLKTLEKFLDWAEERGADSPCPGFWTGLGELLHDVRRDVKILSRAPFPLTEWQGESWKKFLAEYDRADNQPDES